MTSNRHSAEWYEDCVGATSEDRFGDCDEIQISPV
jgi:hypothetical protein